jgi:hypothetical protein
VVVVDINFQRPYYEKAFWFMGLSNQLENPNLKQGTKAKVFNVCYCNTNNFNLYAIRDSEGNECVIGEEGIKLVGIDKTEWLAASSRLFDSWMKISGGYVPKEGGEVHTIRYDRIEKVFTTDFWIRSSMNFFNFETNEQAEQFLQENEKDLLIYFHQS